MRKCLPNILTIRDIFLELTLVTSKALRYVDRPLNFQLLLTFYLKKLEGELKVGSICSDLQKQAENMEGVYCYSSSSTES